MLKSSLRNCLITNKLKGIITMQRKLVTSGKQLGNEIVNLPNQDTPNYKVAAAATTFLAFNTIVSSLNCGSFSFYLNAAATLFSAGITANQYFEGTPLKQATSMYAGLFGTKAKTGNSQTLAEATKATTDVTAERTPTPSPVR